MSMKLLTIRQAAGVLQVPRPRVYEMAREGLLPPGVVVRLGRQVRLNPERLREWLDEGGQALSGGWRKDETEVQAGART